ncbi:MAG: rhamnulokinase [Candidatus Aminicenantes bacterium]|nr:rhamnulokinase [Candidatus Aminicenantes bacterium]
MCFLMGLVRHGRNRRQMGRNSFLAFDIGAESGRALIGKLEQNRIQVQEVYRFQNSMISRGPHLKWDVHSLFREIKSGMRKSAQESQTPFECMGIDTWGVDFGLLNQKGELISLPFAYRDPRNKKAMDAFLRIKSRENVYELTGIQFLQFNSLFQLHALKTQNPEIMDHASHLLFMPDIFNYFLTGEMATEFSYATTSQLFNPRKDGWEDQLFEALDVPKAIMQEVRTAGHKLGLIKPSITEETRFSPSPVVLTAAHDTASAVAAVPAQGKDWAFISSGTWSIMGVELDSPLINEKSYQLNFTNEGGVGHRFRLSKNITGLWLLQECKKKWDQSQNRRYHELIQEAYAAEPFKFLVDPDWEMFLKPRDMTEAIARFCQKTGQTSPENISEFVRSILESLAFKYKMVFDELCSLSRRSINRVHIIGGGSLNQVLCQFTADALGLPVIAGPGEATAVGNIMIQAMAENKMDSIETMRDVISNSFDLRFYEPKNTEEWDENYPRFQEMCRQARTGLKSQK